MIEPRQFQTEPCVALHMEDDGLTMNVNARLTEGARLWTAEEAGEWFKKQWEDARLTLHVSTVARFTAGGNGHQMVRHGQVAWTVTETEPTAAPRIEAPAAPKPAPAIAQEAPVVEVAEEPDAPAPEPVAAAPAAKGDEKPADPTEVILQLLIDGGKKTISELKAETGLNDYQTRRALKVLKEGKRVNEKIRGRTATYTSR
jgi:hypothetical protein